MSDNVIQEDWTSVFHSSGTVLVFTWIGSSIASRAGAHPECY